MGVYKVDITPLSLFSDRISSYTIFGAFCWGYRLLNGEDSLKQFLNEFAEKPKFLVSAVLPKRHGKYFFPKPLLKPERNPELSNLDIKSLKKLSYVDIDIFIQVLEGKIKTEAELYKAINQPTSIKLFEEDLVPHAQIDRISSITEEAGEFYYQEVVVPSEGFFLVYFIEDSIIEDFKAVLRLIEDIGLGGDRSRGLGAVKFSNLERWSRFDSFINQKTDRFILLSPLIPEPNIYNLKESFYDYKVFRGAVDNDYDFKGINIWKNKVLYITEGSNLKLNKQKDFYGQLYHTNGVYQYGFGFPIYIKGEKR